MTENNHKSPVTRRELMKSGSAVTIGALASNTVSAQSDVGPRHFIDVHIVNKVIDHDLDDLSNLRTLTNCEEHKYSIDHDEHLLKVPEKSLTPEEKALIKNNSTILHHNGFRTSGRSITGNHPSSSAAVKFPKSDGYHEIILLSEKNWDPRIELNANESKGNVDLNVDTGTVLEDSQDRLKMGHKLTKRFQSKTLQVAAERVTDELVNDEPEASYQIERWTEEITVQPELHITNHGGLNIEFKNSY